MIVYPAGGVPADDGGFIAVKVVLPATVTCVNVTFALPPGACTVTFDPGWVLEPLGLILVIKASVLVLVLVLLTA